MSIVLLAAAWDLEIGSTEKMVLMCLCDHANEEGTCWPSVARIGRKTSKSERTVQAALKWLREAGYFTVERQRGPTPLYRLDAHRIRASANPAPPQSSRRAPANPAPEPSGNPQDSDSARGVDDGDAGEGRAACAASSSSSSSSSEEPALTMTSYSRPPETDVENAAEPPPLDPPSGRRRGRAQPGFALPGWVPAEPWDAFVEMRRETGHKLTGRAKRLAIAELERLRDAGEDPGAVLDQSTLKAWRGLFAVTRPRWRTDARMHGEAGRWAERGQAGRAEAPLRPAAGPAPRAPLPVTADGRVTREGSIRALIERAALYRKIGRDDDARAAERDAERLRRAAAGSSPAGGGGHGNGGCGNGGCGA